jgi:hypothetical protein
VSVQACLVVNLILNLGVLAFLRFILCALMHNFC